MTSWHTTVSAAPSLPRVKFDTQSRGRRTSFAVTSFRSGGSISAISCPLKEPFDTCAHRSRGSSNKRPGYCHAPQISPAVLLFPPRLRERTRISRATVHLEIISRSPRCGIPSLHLQKEISQIIESSRVSMDTENNGNPWDLEAAPSCEIELNLGLSLGGCFGIGQSPRKVLERSSSVAFVSLVQSIPGKSRSSTAIKKTRSLPFEKKRRRDENIGRFENRTVRIASAPRSLFGSSDNQTGNPILKCRYSK